MRKYFIFAAIGVAVGFLSPQPVGAFVADQNGVTKAATAANTVIDVKGSPPGSSHGRKVGWHGHSRPPGWSHGRKVGWQERGRPPGQP
jgi:hypothetical protein